MKITSTKASKSASAAAQTADATVIGGPGHVGIPLLLAFAEAGFTVNLNNAQNEVAT